MKNIRYQLMQVIIVIVFLVLVLVFYNNYQNTVEIIQSEYKAKHTLVEESIFNTIKYADTIGQIAEQEMNGIMKERSKVLVEKYAQDPNVMNWNLEQLKSRIGLDIYIINDNLQVINTTFLADLGMDFKQFPTFSQLLESRLQGNSFVTDRMDLSTNTGKLMKYSYMPTPDHKYLLELSINMEEKFPVMAELDLFSAAAKLSSQYSSVDDIVIYKSEPSGKGVLKISNDKPFYKAVYDSKNEKYIKEAINSEQVQLLTNNDEPSGSAFTHKYIPYVVNQKSGEFSWWNSYVTEIIYNEGVMLNEISKHRMGFFETLLLFTLMYVTFAAIIIFLLRKSEHMAYHDHLTNLPNRKLFQDIIRQRITDSQKNKYKLAILFLDLDNFKKVNDVYGHAVGDQILKQFAEVLKRNFRKRDTISRLGGDEFVVLLSDVETRNDVIEAANKIKSLFSSPVKTAGKEILISLSIGISICPEDGDAVDVLIKKADDAMYYAKGSNLDFALYSEIVEL